MKIIYYYQTFIGLDQVLSNPNVVDVIIISAVHFGGSKDEPYIHLNDHIPDNPIFDPVWTESQRAVSLGIKVHIMVGGAGSAYQVLFSDFDTYYGLLKDMLQARPWITGIDLDVEESVQLDDIKRLIRTIREDFGPDFIITMAPDQSALQREISGCGGFIYKDLYRSPEGLEIAWFNVQAYCDYSLTAFQQMIDNGYPASKLVYGMLSGQFNQTNFGKAIAQIRAIHIKYPGMGGVYNWEYFDSMPGPPIAWAELMYYLGASGPKVRGALGRRPSATAHEVLR